MNKIIIIGNVGRDPEMRYTQGGNSVTSFSVADNNKYTTRDGEKHEETEWFNVSAFGRQAEICNQYLSKGSQVYIEGRVKSRTYQGNDGQTRHSLDVTVQNVQLLGGRDDDRQQSQGSNQSSRNNDHDEIDDLPF